MISIVKRIEILENVVIFSVGLSVIAVFWCVFMNVRYFCHVTEKGNPLGDLSYKGMQALENAGCKVRVISLTPARFDEETRWMPYQDHFTSSLDEPYINVVCGSADELKRFWTVGTENISLTLPREPVPFLYSSRFVEPEKLALYLQER